MSQIVKMAEKESAHAGFLSHLSSIMDELSKGELADFQGRVMQLAYEMLRNKDFK